MRMLNGAASSVFRLLLLALPRLGRLSRVATGFRLLYGEVAPAVDMTKVPAFATTEAQKRERRKLVSEGGPIVNMLIGNAIGDAFGFNIEFEDAYWIRTAIHVNDTAKGPEGWPVRSYQPEWTRGVANYDNMRGMYSDDCEMTVANMKAMVACGRGINKTCMLEYWREEWDLSAQRSGLANAGIRVGSDVKRSGHGSILNVWKGKTTLEDVRVKASEKETPGNQPPMSALPLAYLNGADLEKAARENADASHPHPKARAASFVMAWAMSWLRKNEKTRSSILVATIAALRSSKASDLATEEHLGKIQSMPDWHSFGHRFKDMKPDTLMSLCGPQPLKESTPGSKNRPRYGMKSDSMRTVGIVLYILKWYRFPREALLASVDVGGDVDSTAALIGGAIGGTTGLRFGDPKGLPWWMIEELEGVEYLVARAKEFERWLSGPATKAPPPPAPTTPQKPPKTPPQAVPRPAPPPAPQVAPKASRSAKVLARRSQAARSRKRPVASSRKRSQRKNTPRSGKTMPLSRKRSAARRGTGSSSVKPPRRARINGSKPGRRQQRKAKPLKRVASRNMERGRGQGAGLSLGGIADAQRIRDAPGKARRLADPLVRAGLNLAGARGGNSQQSDKKRVKEDRTKAGGGGIKQLKNGRSKGPGSARPRSR